MRVRVRYLFDWKFLFIAVAAFLLAAPSRLIAEETQAEISFGLHSTEDPATQKPKWEPFFAAMSKATGLKVKGYYAADYETVIDAMAENKVQIAWYGNKSGMEAVDRAGGEVFAQAANKDGASGYYSHLIVRNDSPLNSLEDVLKCDKSLDFGIGDPNSTSGFLVPTTYIFAAENIDPKTCFRSIHSANHQGNAVAVVEKKVDFATNNSEDLQRLAKSMPDVRKQLRIIWTSPLIPLDPLVWRKDLEPSVKVKLYNFFLSYGRFGTAEENAAAREILGKLLWAPFHPSSNSQLVTVRMLEATKKLVAIRDNEKLPMREKAKQMADTIAKISQLGDQRSKLANDPVQKQVDLFIAAERAGDDGTMKKTIEAFAEAYSTGHY